MRSGRIRLTGFLVAAAVSAGAPAAAVAGGGGSASNSQYVDPLAGITTPKTTTHAATHPRPTVVVPTPTSDPVPSSAPPLTTSGTTLVTTPTATDPSRTLPYTGYPAWEITALGLGLAATGTALRRHAS